MYSRKIIQNLKPEWYLNLPTKEKNDIQQEMRDRHDKMWLEKPNKLSYGCRLIAKEDSKSLTKGTTYRVMNHFCTLVTTIYDSNWNEFVTLKNDNGWTVKMNLNNFELKK